MLDLSEVKKKISFQMINYHSDTSLRQKRRRVKKITENVCKQIAFENSLNCNDIPQTSESIPNLFLNTAPPNINKSKNSTLISNAPNINPTLNSVLLNNSLNGTEDKFVSDLINIIHHNVKVNYFLMYLYLNLQMMMMTMLMIQERI